MNQKEAEIFASCSRTCLKKFSRKYPYVWTQIRTGSQIQLNLRTNETVSGVGSIPPIQS